MAGHTVPAGSLFGEAAFWQHHCNGYTKCSTAILSVVAHCEVFDNSGGGVAKMCKENIPFLGKVLMDPQLYEATKEGWSCFAD